MRKRVAEEKGYLQKLKERVEEKGCLKCALCAAGLPRKRVASSVRSVRQVPRKRVTEEKGCLKKLKERVEEKGCLKELKERVEEKGCRGKGLPQKVEGAR